MNFQEKWRKLLLPLRYGGSGVDFKKLDPARSPFLQDRDRIIYSSSFRRLARKTQVHPLVRNDHIHTRLSHSLEVSSVGRSLGAMAGYFLHRRDELPEYAAPEFPGQILEAACLAHD
ncbi:MAG: deoxyguanosinetriphosphate triphosphohydrolase, partial [Desulfovibrio sp.]|nr:deoxyguanosinetriphosphate triphosphohydrolase [Desulfovibrio sp.]